MESTISHPRYMGIPTFMRQIYAESAEGLDIALVGIPYDGGVTNRPGARHGPREIRDASSLTRAIHHVTQVNPFEMCTIADLGDVMFSKVFDDAVSMAEIEVFFANIVKAGAAPISAGGDHSVTYPILKALGAEAPLHVVHIDAHTDTWDVFQGSKFHHGAPFRRAVEDGVIDPKSMIQIGIRGAQNETTGWDYSLESGMRVIFMEEFTALGVDAVVAEARRVVGKGPVYISFDVDGLDPVYAPGTGTPEIGGLTTIEGQALIRGLRGLNIVGGDVVEVSPPFDQTGNTSMVAATLMYEMLCILAEAVEARKNT